MSRKKAIPATTNITPAHQELFEEVRSGHRGLALFSCFVNGIPSAAIVRVSHDKDGMVLITPLFVSIEPGMSVKDHDGNEAAPISPDQKG